MRHRYNVWVKSVNDNENHFTALITDEEAKELEAFLKAEAEKERDGELLGVAEYVVVRNQDMTFKQVSADLKTWLAEA